MHLTCYSAIQKDCQSDFRSMPKTYVSYIELNLTMHLIYDKTTSEKLIKVIINIYRRCIDQQRQKRDEVERWGLTLLVSGVVAMVETMTGGPVRRPTILLLLRFCAWRVLEEVTGTMVLSVVALSPFRRSWGL